MYALNLSSDGRCLSASPASMAPIGAVFVSALPEGDLYEYRRVDGQYVHDPLPAPEPSETFESISSEELTDLRNKAAAHDILMEGVST